jgi:hypothetical protein
MTLNKQVLTQPEESLGLTSVREATGNAAPVKSSMPVTYFRPVISGIGGFCFKPVVPLPQINAEPESEKQVPIATIQPTLSPVHVLDPYSKAELEAEDGELHGSGSGTTSPHSSFDNSFASSYSGSSSFVGRHINRCC